MELTKAKAKIARLKFLALSHNHPGVNTGAHALAQAMIKEIER